MHNDDVLDKDVFDVNGQRIGHAVLAREADDELLSFDVELVEKLRLQWRAPERVTIPAEDIVATDIQVTLAEDARYIVHPEQAPAPSRE